MNVMEYNEIFLEEKILVFPKQYDDKYSWIRIKACLSILTKDNMQEVFLNFLFKNLDH